MTWLDTLDPWLVLFLAVTLLWGLDRLTKRIEGWLRRRHEAQLRDQEVRLALVKRAREWQARGRGWDMPSTHYVMRDAVEQLIWAKGLTPQKPEPVT